MRSSDYVVLGIREIYRSKVETLERLSDIRNQKWFGTSQFKDIKNERWAAVINEIKLLNDNYSCRIIE